MLNVLVLCFSITGCGNKNDLTDEQLDLLTSTDTFEGSSNLLQDMEDEGYNFELNPETSELIFHQLKIQEIILSFLVMKMVLIKRKKVL